MEIEKYIKDTPICDMKYTPTEGYFGDKAIVRGLGHRQTCFQCKKVFEMFNPTLYAYKIRKQKATYIFCSWGCMCKYRKEQDVNAKRRKKG